MQQEDNDIESYKDILANKEADVNKADQDSGQVENDGEVKDFFRRRGRKIADDKTEENTLDPTIEVVPETRARRLRKKQVGSKERNGSVEDVIGDDEPVVKQTRQAKKSIKSSELEWTEMAIGVESDPESESLNTQQQKPKKGKDKVVKKQKAAGQVNGIKPQNKLVDFVLNNELFGNDDDAPAKKIEHEECGLDLGRK